MAETTTQAARSGSDVLSRLNAALRRTDIFFAISIIAILAVLVLPLPKWAMDFSLTISITFSIIILMTALSIEKPLDLNAFPTILLIATMLRLSLNLASTRLILTYGHEGTGAAGKVIQAFGSFVMGGNYVIGMIVFAILIIVNFVVITKGSGRIAEVSARFSLDAMPGKQMAIDADLSAGLIAEEEARSRRRLLEDESAFFGAMDGAAKFVRGDAIAGLLIVFINIVGGIVIGVVQQGLSLAQAADYYTVLTVGDGLVTQIPALIVSTSAGMVVSKAGVIGTADKAIIGQLSQYPKALGISSALLLVLSTLPGIPMVPFLILAGGTGWLAWSQNQRLARDEMASAEAERVAKEQAAPAKEPVSAALQIDVVRMELGYALLSMISTHRDVRLTDQIKALRRQLAQEMGFVLPAVRIQDNVQLPSNTYVVRIKEIEAGRGELRPNMLLVMDPRGEHITLPGEETTEPTFGLPAMWITEDQREEAQFRGFTVVDAPTVITTHLTEIIKDNMPELLSFSETQKLLDDLDQDQQKLVADLVPKSISVGAIQRVLQNLLAERISIRDLPTILEGISEAVGYTHNVNAITEHVRTRLARQISDSNTGEGGYIPIITLSPEWEQSFAESIVGKGEELQLSMPPSKLQEFISGVRQTFDRQAMVGETPVLLTSPRIRPYVRSIIERFRPNTVVMSQNEVHPKAKIKTLGHI